MNELSSLVVCPSFYCNYNCEYCYLGDLRKDKQILDLNILKERLKNVEDNYYINSIQVLGGEISLLNQQYFYDLYNIIKNYELTFTTNLSNDWLINFCLQTNCQLSISLNEERPNYEYTLNKLKKLKGIKNITLSSVVLPSLLKKQPSEVLNFYNELGFNVYFLEYEASVLSRTQYNIDLKDYMSFLHNLLKEYHKGNYDIKILNEIAYSDKDYKRTIDKVLTINPNGKFAISINNKNGFYQEFDTINEFNNMCDIQRPNVMKNCSKCAYFSKCKSEHLVSSNPTKCQQLFKLMELYNDKTDN